MIGEDEEKVAEKFKEDAHNLAEEIEKDKEEIREIISEAPQEERKEIEKEAAEITRLAEDAIKREEKLEKAEEKYQQAIKEQDATELISKVREKKEASNQDKEDMLVAEKLYEHLKKHGTLKEAKKEEPKLDVKGKYPTADEIISFQRKKMLSKGVPTAHELLSRKNKLKK